MPVPISQAWTVATYVLKQKLRGRKRYPFVLMLEPLFRCNLACAGCGKIQYPAHILKTNLTPEQCFAAVDECGTPMVSIPGGEPLMHPQIEKIVEGLVARKKYIYLCTNALLLKEKLHLFQPSKYLTFSAHMDGQKEHHDFSVCREGGYELAVEGIKEALKRGFRVTRNISSDGRARVGFSARFWRTARGVGSSTSHRSSLNSSWANGLTPARPGECLRTTFSAGKSLAISCRTVTRTRSRSCWIPLNGKTMARNRVIRSAPTAWCTAAMRPLPSTTRLADSRGCGPP